MVLLRTSLGDVLRSRRLRQGRTLREISSAARVSLGYLSEVERGHKEASSELLASICAALGVPLADVLREASDSLDLVGVRPYRRPLEAVPSRLRRSGVDATPPPPSPTAPVAPDNMPDSLPAFEAVGGDGGDTAPAAGGSETATSLATSVLPLRQPGAPPVVAAA